MVSLFTIFIVHIVNATYRLVLAPMPERGTPGFEVEILEKDAAQGARWVKPSMNGYGPAIIAMVMHYLMKRTVAPGSTVEVGHAARLLASPRQCGAQPELRCELASAGVPPPDAASASVRMALDETPTHKPHDVFDDQARDILAIATSPTWTLAEEIRGRYRALKLVEWYEVHGAALAKALEAACAEIEVHNANASFVEGEYPTNPTPIERLAEWRKLAQEFQAEGRNQRPA